MSNNNRSLFFVQSPMQLLNAIEAKHFFKLKRCHLIIRKNGIENNNKQLQKVLEYDLDFEKIKFIKITNVFLYYKFLILFIELICFKFDKVFIGDYYSKIVSLFIKFVSNNKIYLLDDGLQSVAIHKENLVHNMFSYFSLEENSLNRSVYKNNFNFLRSISSINKRKILNVVYFIGAPLVEKDVLSIADFTVLMSKIIKYYKNQGLEIIYSPHRAEELDKFRELDLTVLEHLELPIEFFFIENKELPFMVVSFYSAALYSLSILFRNKIKITSFYIPEECIDVNSRESLNECYHFYETQFKVDRNLKKYHV